MRRRFEDDGVPRDECWEDGVDGCQVRVAGDTDYVRSSRFIECSYSLPRSDNEHHTDGYALYETLETRLIGVLKLHIGQRLPRDADHISRAFQSTTDLPSILSDRALSRTALVGCVWLGVERSPYRPISAVRSKTISSLSFVNSS